MKHYLKGAIVEIVIEKLVDYMELLIEKEEMRD
jgi:hypothetical protein